MQSWGLGLKGLEQAELIPERTTQHSHNPHNTSIADHNSYSIAHTNPF